MAKSEFPDIDWANSEKFDVRIKEKDETIDQLIGQNTQLAEQNTQQAEEIEQLKQQIADLKSTVKRK